MTGTVKAPDAKRRREASRLAILNATTDLIGEVGHAGCTVDAIAARAGVGKQTIYRWWPDKNAVIVDAYLNLVAAENELVFPTTDDVAADLYRVLSTLAGTLQDPVFARRYRALLTAVQDDEDLAAAITDTLARPFIELTAARLRAAAALTMTDAQLVVAAEAFYGGVYYRWQLRLGTLTDGYIATHVDNTLRAIGAR